MKKCVVLLTLTILFFAMILAGVSYKHSGPELFPRSSEALTSQESYDSPVWIVAVLFDMDTREIIVSCVRGGEYTCPLIELIEA